MLESIALLAIKGVTWFLKKNEADKEMWQLFYDFVGKFQKSYLNSTKLTDHVKAQNHWLDTNKFVETA